MAEKNFSIFRLLLSKLSVEAFMIKSDFLNQELLIKTIRMWNYWSQIKDYGLIPEKRDIALFPSKTPPSYYLHLQEKKIDYDSKNPPSKNTETSVISDSCWGWKQPLKKPQ